MSRRFPFELIKDLNGNPVHKFLDAFETVRMDMGGEPKFYGDMHPDRHFVIRKHVTDENGEHITFYFGSAPETLADVWTNRATLDYGEYSEVF